VTNSPLAASFGDLAMVIESETSGAATLQWNVGWVDVVELPGAGDKGVGAAPTALARTAAVTATAASKLRFWHRPGILVGGCLEPVR
jgi:hypothetical protein